MNKQTGISPQVNSADHLVRPRINALLEKAIEKPLVVVCAGAGYGKTQAVYDFVRENKIATLWVQLSEHDNVPSRFWESFVHGIAQIDGVSAVDDFRNLGFPDTDDKVSQYISFRDRGMTRLSHRRYLAVFDDFHLIKNPEVIRFFERFIRGTQESHSIILISRENPKTNIAALRIRDDVFDIQEEALKFTETELSNYLTKHGLSLDPAVLREVYRDIDGWAFPVNLIARCLKKSPGYAGFARDALKMNIFELMEAEVFDAVSEKLRRFMVSLSLVENLSKELIETLACGDEILLDEFRQQSIYTRYDVYMNAYLIHHLFLDFLRTKQDILTEDEKRSTYQAAAKWCKENDYLVDALGYCERIGDYEAIVSIFFDMPFFLPYNFALHMLDMFKRLSEELFFQVDFLAVMYLRTVIALGRSEEFNSLAESFKQKFLQMPENSQIRKHTLGLIYYFQGLMRLFMSTTDGRYDFDIYFAKMDEYMADTPIDPGIWLANSPGPWAIGLGSDKLEAAIEYREASFRMAIHVNKCLNGILIGLDSLAIGELKFYQGEMQDTESLFVKAIEDGKEVKQFETIHRALFYTMRAAFAQGELDQASEALRRLGALQEEKEYPQRYITYDIAQGWYYYVLRQPDMIPSWLKEKFSPYAHAYFPENFGNQMKARYHYMTKNYAPLLTYIEEMKQRESILYGRMEMLAIEACARYQMRDKTGAIAVLREGYEITSSKGILMPFIELGKDIRAFTTAVLRDADCGIPTEWLELINKRAQLYAKHQAIMTADYEREIGASSWITLSPRETEVLHDLYSGLTRRESATKRGLSIHTVNTNVQSLYMKLHANNMADIFRVAVERKLL